MSIFRVILTVLSLMCVSTGSIDHRTKRFLLFPRFSPTRIQVITGIGIPVDLDLETVTIGYVFKSEFYLPDNVSDLMNPLANPFDVSTHPISTFDRKRRSVVESTTTKSSKAYQGYDSIQNEKYEKHNVDAEIVDSGTEFMSEIEGKIDDELFVPEDNKYDNDPMSFGAPQNIATSRWTIYNGMATMAESKGFTGKPCVLRSICESAHTSFDYSSGILGELTHILMTPSTSHDEISCHHDLEYFEAEKLGKEGAPCEHIFSECTTSMLKQFSGIYT